jgi:peptidyl-prolyl cis-trans isomerase C
MICSNLSRNLACLSLVLVLTLTACGAPGGVNLIPATFTPTLSPTPTVTPIPLAISVNGEGVPVAEFEAELERYKQAQTSLGKIVNLEAANKAVSDEFIDILLLAQGAAGKGYRVDDAALNSRIDNLAVQVGGSEALTAWQTAHGYTDGTFRSDLRLQMAAASMRDLLASSVSVTAEQVHVQQILLTASTTAQQTLDYLKAGRNFKDLAAQYDPLTKGDLGWFPRGYLSDPAIEAAAFALQPGQYSDIIQPQAGYAILFLVERNPARPLSPDALLTLQKRAVHDWLTKQRSESKILFAP